MENSEVQKPDLEDANSKPRSSNISLALLATFFIVVILALSFIYWKKIYPEGQSSSRVYVSVSQESSATSQTEAEETQTENETGKTAFTPALIDTETEQAVSSSLADFDSILSDFDSILKDLNSINTTQDNSPTL